MKPLNPTASDTESALAETAALESNPLPATAISSVAEILSVHDFRNPVLVPPREMRKLWQNQEEFVQSLARRMTSQLRMDFVVTLTGLQTVIYKNFSATWANPSNLVIFKMDALRGVGLMEIRPAIALTMVDRLMGGPGSARTESLELSEIERVLLDQSVQVILEEWAAHWSSLKELKASVLGYESDGNFVQTCTPETILLVLTLSITLGSVADRIQIAVPFSALEPLIRQITQEKEIETPKPVPSTPTVPKWNAAYDDVCIPVMAQWQGIELSVREIVNLKVGDLISLDPAVIQSTQVCLGEAPRFEGLPGAIEGKWAVELVKSIETVK